MSLFGRSTMLAVLALTMAACGESSYSSQPSNHLTTTTTTAETTVAVEPAPESQPADDSEAVVTTTKPLTPAEQYAAEHGTIDSGTYRIDVGSASIYQFKSPSGTLNCAISIPKAGSEQTSSVAQCAVNDTKPASDGFCDARNATGAMVLPWGAQYNCSGEACAGDAPVLPYGETIAVDFYTCKSETTGMSCYYTLPGFTVSRDAITIY